MFFFKKQKEEKHITISLIIFSYTEFLIFFNFLEENKTAYSTFKLQLSVQLLQ